MKRKPIDYQKAADLAEQHAFDLAMTLARTLPHVKNDYAYGVALAELEKYTTYLKGCK